MAAELLYDLAYFQHGFLLDARTTPHYLFRAQFHPAHLHLRVAAAEQRLGERFEGAAANNGLLLMLGRALEERFGLQRALLQFQKTVLSVL